MGKYISRESVENLLGYLQHIKVIDRKGFKYMLELSYGSDLRFRHRPQTRAGRSDAVRFDQLLLKWTDKWGGQKIAVQKAGLHWNYMSYRTFE